MLPSLADPKKYLVSNHYYLIQKLIIVKHLDEYLTIPRLKDTVFLSIGSTLRMENARYIYVAKKQNSKFAVQDKHTFEEKLLFTNILTNSFTATTGINYETFAKMWNGSNNYK